jgi:beta-ureidopropionase / N-carbamoyl-L-amino-acid hydrolase
MTLDQFNAAPAAQALAWLDGVYEHSPWVAEAALTERPFKSLAHLKLALVQALRKAGREQQLALLRAHPELAGKAMLASSLTAQSASEQTRSGLTHCSAGELATLQALNTAYGAKFAWPFVLALGGPRGVGLTRGEIIATFERRLSGHPDFEFAECLRQVHRIAELRLNDKFGFTPVLGNAVWDWAEQLARHTDPGCADPGQLSVTYLSEAHRACAQDLAAWMRECGFDDVAVDAVGNVVGVYLGASPRPRTLAAGEGVKRLLTGSHYDTVRNAGKYDGRLGILVPMLCVRELHAQGRRLGFDLEVVGFAEEEGQRYKTSFLGSGALVGQFDTEWLAQTDAEGISMRQAMTLAGLKVDAIASIQRDPARYVGFIETHIEQGPVLNALDLPLGVVTSINGSLRYAGEVVGMASHAGTTPMDSRRDAATAVAELALFLERRAAAEPNLVGTMGMLSVPEGSTNVVPGRCRFSLDIRATTDAVRDACAGDVLAELARIGERRGLHVTLEQTMRAAAAPCAPEWQARWERAVRSIGLPVHRLPSGAGHDAMKLHEVMPQAMLFVRGGNAGISHNPLESITSDDAQLCVEAFQHLLNQGGSDPT